MRKKLGIIFMIIGIGIFFYPDIATCYQEIITSKYIKKFDQENRTKDKNNDIYYEASLSYNSKIYEDGQGEFKDAWICAQSPVVLDGSFSQCFGYIEIPSMNIKLPLFIGASGENMTKGAAVLGGTSLPIGGNNTNSVIAGHRGYRGMPFFKEIEKLKTGDRISIKNPWEQLTYIVESVKVIDPYDADSVKIQKGRDMVTLITCHPYRGHGKYRYIVYCARDKGQTVEEKNMEGEVLFQSSEKEINMERRFRICCGICILFLNVVTLMKKG